MARLYHLGIQLKSFRKTLEDSGFWPGLKMKAAGSYTAQQPGCYAFLGYLQVNTEKCIRFGGSTQ
jgi:hypothetical protein